APWGAVIGQQTYTIDSAIPGQAFKALRPYLKLRDPDDEKPEARTPLPCRADAPAVKPVTTIPAPAKLAPASIAAPSAEPMPDAGETINLAARHSLRSTQSILAYVMGGSATVADSTLVAQFVALLNQPLVVVPSTSLGPSYFDDFTLVFLKSASSS